jgi:hypothetical protein
MVIVYTSVPNEGEKESMGQVTKKHIDPHHNFEPLA